MYSLGVSPYILFKHPIKMLGIFKTQFKSYLADRLSVSMMRSFAKSKRKVKFISLSNENIQRLFFI